MMDLSKVQKTARRKKKYQVKTDISIPSRHFRAILLVEPVPADLLMNAAYVKVRGNLYRIYHAHDDPHGFGMDDRPELPDSFTGFGMEDGSELSGSLVGEMVEFIERDNPRK